MKSFDIITLDAKKMLERIRSDAVEEKTDGNFGIRIRYDLSIESEEKDIVFREESYSFDENWLSNALFDQLLKVISSEDLLRQSFLYIDFKKIFSKKDFWELPTKEILSKEELCQDSKSARGYKLKTMFKDGIELSFDGKDYKHFVPFDKSSNNARHCVISFIDEKVKSELEPRLMVGMDLSNLRLPLSKYYAYRGLYLSSARQIESKAIVLNAQTVIVLKDFPQTIHNANVFTATENDSDATWKFKPDQQNFSLNLFDGEGIISPEYSKAINACLKKMLKHKYKGDSHSFQIRLPFTKGVLHEVDFVKFFREKLKISSMKIKDIFGRERDLSKAHIILTESMFKCSSWIANNNIRWIAMGDRPVSADPMENFFNGIEHYDHALYVAMTDVNLSNNGTVRLNYQFLSTLQFNLDDFESLKDEHIKKIEDAPNILKEIFSEALIDEIDNEEDFDFPIDNDELDESTDSDADTDAKNDSAPKKDLQTDDADDKTTEPNARKKIFRVLARNKTFLKETKVRSAISDFQRDKQRDLFLGHFNIQGEQRFLSRDLLGFLLQIAKRLYGDKNKQDLSECIKTWTLTSQKFYMPNSTERLQESYVFLRSPHLSPNEQCLLRPLANKANKNLYDEYFGHLRGVVMVSCKSLVPLALGGADFDGDLVKIISDRRVVDAVKKLYTDSYERTLPVIKIPSAKAKSDENIPPNITFELVEKTFSNQVGHISNIAVNLINLADRAETEDERKKFLRLVAESAIVVGLEIDAVKTGKRPETEIQSLNDALNGKPKSLFLRIKKKILDLKSVRFTPIVKPDGRQLIFYTSKKNEEFNNAAFSVRKQDTASYKGALIDLLPQFYLEHLREKADNQNHDEMTANKSKNIYFEFQREKTWKATLDNQALAKVEALAKTFNAIRRLDKESESFLLWWEKKHRDSYFNAILDIQYDNAETVSEAKKQMYLTLQNLKDVDEALKALRKKNWHLTSKDERTDRLKEILKLEEIDSDVIDLLSNFRENGYMLIFYALCECKVQLNTKADVDDGLSLIRDNESDKWKNLRELIASVAGNSYWKNFYDKYRSYRRDPLISRKKFKQSLVRLCRNALSEIFDGNFDEALKYFWAKQNACDPSHNFFWDVFDEEEIIRNLPETCRQGVDEHA